jgi:hypothetical protein
MLFMQSIFVHSALHYSCSHCPCLSDIIAKCNLSNSYYMPFSSSYSDTGLTTYIMLLENDALNYCHLVDTVLPTL